ncbi:MAG: AmmeMemoRadiSam system protein B, partial [bacterium]
MRNISRRTLIRILLGATAAAVLPVRWTIRRVRGAVSRTEARFYRKLCVLLVLGASLALAPPACKARSVQEPVVAGAFYPADPSQLREMVSSFISRAGSPQVRGEILGLVAPHAGYVYSGPAAGHAYREIKGRRFDVVVVIAPSHTSPMAGVSVLDMDAYRTPLGEVIIDREAVGTLMERAQWIRHVPALFAREHSMEVHLPFLQVALEPGFRLVPVVMGSPSPGLAAAFADVLASAFRGRSVLYIASSDMSHYLPYDQAREMDGRTLEYIAGGEIDT